MQTIVAKEIQAPSLDQLNAKLRKKLDELLDLAEPENILDITEAVAKLNSSYKGNQQFGEPVSDEEKQEKAQKELLDNILNGEVVN